MSANGNSSAPFVAGSVEALRGGVACGAYDVAMQRLYERWLKRDDWRARHEAIPLAVGVPPERWQAYLQEHGLGDAEEELWRLFADGTGVRGEEEMVPVATVDAWFRGNGVDLPASFVRLYDFIRRAVPVPAAFDRSDDPVDGRAHELQDEKEIVLGAALSLLSRMPHRCRDEHGFVDGGALVQLILETAARWFPATGPTMTRHEMARLIDRWLE
jgi:hypothetical protein